MSRPTLVVLAAIVGVLLVVAAAAWAFGPIGLAVPGVLLIAVGLFTDVGGGHGT